MYTLTAAAFSFKEKIERRKCILEKEQCMTNQSNWGVEMLRHRWSKGNLACWQLIDSVWLQCREAWAEETCCYGRASQISSLLSWVLEEHGRLSGNHNSTAVDKQADLFAQGLLRAVVLKALYANLFNWHIFPKTIQINVIASRKFIFFPE